MIGSHDAERIGNPARLPKLLFNGIVRSLRLSAELVRALEVKRQLLFEMRHSVHLRRST